MTADLRRRLGPTALRAAWGTRDVLDLDVFPVSGGPGPAADPARSLEDLTAGVLEELRQRAQEGRTEALMIISRRNTPSRTSYAAFGTTRTRALYSVPGVRRTLGVPVRGPR